MNKDNSGLDVKSFNIKNLIFCALFTGLTCVFARFTVPIGVVPITLANLVIYFAGAMLGPLYGALSQVLYLILVFVGFGFTAKLQAGPAYLVGPTAGYMYGYILMAFFVGLIYKRFGKNSEKYIVKVAWLIIGCVVGTVSCYFLGTVWLMFQQKISVEQALLSGVYPFLLGDSIKILIASLVFPRFEKIIR